MLFRLTFEGVRRWNSRCLCQNSTAAVDQLELTMGPKDGGGRAGAGWSALLRNPFDSGYRSLDSPIVVFVRMSVRDVEPTVIPGDHVNALVDHFLRELAPLLEMFVPLDVSPIVPRLGIRRSVVGQQIQTSRGRRGR